MAILGCIGVATAQGCATYLDDLNRADQHFQANDHERALALLRVVERDIDSLSHVDRTRYAYLRGMNDYRLGQEFRPDARHWLAIARALERDKPGGLTDDWKSKLEDALRDLNQDYYGQGVFPDEASEQPARAEAQQSGPAPQSGESPGTPKP